MYSVKKVKTEIARGLWYCRQTSQGAVSAALQMTNRKLKFGAACIGLLVTGTGIPAFAIHWQNSKAAG